MVGRASGRQGARMQPGDTSGQPDSRGRLVCAVGADEHAERLVRAARRLATVTGLLPLFVHVVPPEDAAAGAIWQARSLLRHAGARTGEMRAVVGDPPTEIIRCASDGDVALLVVAARGFGPLKAALLGSVSRALMLQAPVPVMVIPPEADPAFDATPAGSFDELRWRAWPEVLVVPRPVSPGTVLEDHLAVHAANRGMLPVVVVPEVDNDAAAAG